MIKFVVGPGLCRECFLGSTQRFSQKGNCETRWVLSRLVAWVAQTSQDYRQTELANPRIALTSNIAGF
jgi:hypothetical protein